MDDLNKMVMTFASTNADPVASGSSGAKRVKQGLDPNVWIGNVEQVASARIGRETVTYVSNIFKYYIAYKLVCRDRTTQRGEGAGREGIVRQPETA